MSVGLHKVTVSEDRAADAWGLPVNVNPYFLTDASGWNLAGGSTWAGGMVTAKFDLPQSAFSPYAGQPRLRLRAVVIVPQGPNVQLAFTITFSPSNNGMGYQKSLPPGKHTVTWDSAPPADAAGSTGAKLHLGVPTGATVNVDSYELFFFNSAAEPVDLSCLVDEVTVHHGREDPSGQPEASTCSLNLSWDARDTELPAEVEMGAVVRVWTRFPTVSVTHAWTGDPDASRSTKTTDPGGTVSNWATNPAFRNDRAGWAGGTGIVLSWQATGSHDDGPYGRAVSDGNLLAGNPVWRTNVSNVPVVGQDAIWDFYARAVGGVTTGRVTFGTAVGTISLGPTWQHYTVRARVTSAATGFWGIVADPSAKLTAGQGIDLDTVLFTLVPGGAPAPEYFDGETPNVGADYTRFTGRVTDIDLSWDDAGENTPETQTAQIVCAGFSADLGRRVVGDAPFPQELDGARVSRIFGLAGVILDPLASDPGTVKILARDIDSQPAWAGAQHTAVSASGVIWYTRDGQVRYADANHRGNMPIDVTLDSCDLLVAPQWIRTLEGLVNKISLGYGTTPEGGEQPRYLKQNDKSLTKYGTYDYTTATELATLADAQALAGLILARNSDPVWVMAAIPVDLANVDDTRTASLLGLDIHALIELTGLPAIGTAPTSTAMFVEGWTERLAWGEHDLSLFVSGYCRTAPPPTWDELDAERTWDNTDAALTWDDISCLGPQVSQGRWNDVPATTRWNTTDPVITWDTWKD